MCDGTFTTAGERAATWPLFGADLCLSCRAARSYPPPPRQRYVLDRILPAGRPRLPRSRGTAVDIVRPLFLCDPGAHLSEPDLPACRSDGPAEQHTRPVDPADHLGSA